MISRVAGASAVFVLIASACTGGDSEFTLASYDIEDSSNEYEFASTIEGTVELGGLTDLVPGAATDGGGDAPLPLNLDVSGRIEITTARDGDDFKITTEILELEGRVDSPAGAQDVDASDLGIDTETEVVVTAEGEPTEADEGDSGGLSGLGGSILDLGFCGPALSGEDLAPGDTWESETPVALGASALATHTYDERDVAGRNAAVIETSIDGAIDDEIDLSQLGGLLGGVGGGLGSLEGIALGLQGNVTSTSTCALEIPGLTMLADSAETKSDFTLSGGDAGSQFAELFSGVKTDVSISSTIEIVE